MPRGRKPSVPLMDWPNHKTPNTWDDVFGDGPVPDTPGQPVSFVYVIAAEKFVKIGWSKNPRTRLSNLRTASPTPLRLVATFEFANDAAEEAEGFIHKKLKRYGRRGEWFKLSPEKAELELMSWFCPLANNRFYSAYLMEVYPPLTLAALP